MTVTGDPVKEFKNRLEQLSDSHRLKNNVLDVEVNTQEYGADIVVTVQKFGRADLEDLHKICDDWEVSVADPENPSNVRLMVWLEKDVPLGGEPDET